MSAAPAHEVTIRIDGRPRRVAGDISVAAALLDADMLAFRRSVRGEARAPLCGMGICHECRVTIDGVAHRRSCLITVAEGMVIETDGRGIAP